jgi:hypothetical protein
MRKVLRRCEVRRGVERMGSEEQYKLDDEEDTERQGRYGQVELLGSREAEGSPVRAQTGR